MQKRRGDNCPWHIQPQAESDLQTLHSILNCASAQGCGECVSCSERALTLFRQVARNRTSGS